MSVVVQDQVAWTNLNIMQMILYKELDTFGSLIPYHVLKVTEFLM